jgi:hypothetical protein
MKYRWLGKNIELSVIEEAVESFLKEQGFKTTSFSNGDSKRLQGVFQDSNGKKIVFVTITGTPSDFTINFAGNEAAQHLTLFGSITTLFGAGPLQLKYLKDKEFYQKIEEKLWNHLEYFIEEKSKE